MTNSEQKIPRMVGINHASVLVGNVDRSLCFYRDLLGMAVDSSRPGGRFPGAWLTVGSQQLHLLELPNPDPVDGRPEHAGRDRHTAFTVCGLDEVESLLDNAGIDFTRSHSGRRAIFCRDPDGNGVELIEG